jgi:hypothetical protein
MQVWHYHVCTLDGLVCTHLEIASKGQTFKHQNSHLKSLFKTVTRRLVPVGTVILNTIEFNLKLGSSYQDCHDPKAVSGFDIANAVIKEKDMFCLHIE